MARVRLLTSAKRLAGPLTYWVHRPQDGDTWARATRFDPPLPPPDASGAFPHYTVEHLGHEVGFASAAEVDHALDVLARDPLPTAQELAQAAGAPERAYMHWIETFPARLKAVDERRRFVQLLEELRGKIAAEA